MFLIILSSYRNANFSPKIKSGRKMCSVSNWAQRWKNSN